MPVIRDSVTWDRMIAWFASNFEIQWPWRAEMSLMKWWNPLRLGTVHELTNVMDKTVETSQMSLVLYFMDGAHLRLVGSFWQHQVQVILARGRIIENRWQTFHMLEFSSHKSLLNLVQAHIGFDALLLPLCFLHCWGTWRSNSNSFVELITSEN